ncbi:F-box-like domain protein [Rhizoctonia solani 123E]|uniref:F-box-like domain protein n=1 Tax=Rhizoctonia solani 123E TaxID=1423351 RepID=A0A074RKB3_9AGAM|nr:F-box-like domain protein [Rhizoctonia solani 123E]
MRVCHQPFFVMFSFRVKEIRTYITYFVLSVHSRIFSVAWIKDADTPTLLSSGGFKRSKPLPVEILDLIFLFYIASLLDDPKYATVRDYRTQQKEFMQEVCKVARCSRLFNRILEESLCRIWASSGRRPSSLTRTSESGMGHPPALGVWIITAETEFFPLDFSLAAYKALEIASINYHRGVEWNQSEQRFVRSLCISAYPRSLRQLEILRLHTPEEEVIKLVADCCPGLTELRLVRCSMFNDPKCWYWRTHTANQDHGYMQSSDPATVVAYANRIALLLRGLRQLEAIHIGHYLIGIDAVLRHRTNLAHKRHHPITDNMYHIDGALVFSPAHFLATANQDGGPPIDWRAVRLADRELWAQPCPQCEHEYGSSIQRAEGLAARILAAHFESVKSVSFAGFLSDRRIRPSPWRVGREKCGEDLVVWADGTCYPQSRKMQQMVRQGDWWQPLQMIQ